MCFPNSPPAPPGIGYHSGKHTPPPEGPMPPDTPATRFVVKRLNWHAGDRGRCYRQPGETAVASFATADEAEADRRRREEEVRRVVNPFACGSALHYLT